MSAVNWAEALSKVAELGKSSRELIAELTARRLLGASLNIIPFTSEDAALAGDLRPLTRRLDLSLGDRACLALGRRLQTEVLTADRAWENLEETLRGPIKVIR